MPAYRRFEVDASSADVLAAAGDELQSRRFRVLVASGPPTDEEGTSGDERVDSAVAAEAGQLRETGNLIFHIAVVVVLVAVAVGSLFGYRATVIVPEGSGFANTVIQYDGLTGGALFDAADLPPFSLQLDEFDMEFVEAGAQRGSPADFEATVRFTREPGAAEETRTIRVNQPLEVDGTLIHILNPGFAPLITVRDAEGTVLAEGAVPFLPQDNSFTSVGVRKVPVGPNMGSGEDLGVQGLFLPTAVLDEQGPRSAFPEPRNPALFLTAFHGDLGLDDGQPQSVYRLDTSDMEQFRTTDGDAFRADLAPGETATLPDGYGSVTFDGYVSWVNFQVSRNAGKEFVLIGAALALAGLLRCTYGGAECGCGSPRPQAPVPWSKSPGCSAPRAATCKPRSTPSPTMWTEGSARREQRGDMDAAVLAEWSRFLVGGAIAAFIVAWLAYCADAAQRARARARARASRLPLELPTASALRPHLPGRQSPRTIRTPALGWPRSVTRSACSRRCCWALVSCCERSASRGRPGGTCTSSPSPRRWWRRSPSSPWREHARDGRWRSGSCSSCS